MRKGLIDLKDIELKELMEMREGRRIESKYSTYNQVDRMMFYKGMRDYVDG